MYIFNTMFSMKPHEISWLSPDTSSWRILWNNIKKEKKTQNKTNKKTKKKNKKKNPHTHIFPTSLPVSQNKIFEELIS